LTCKKNRNNKFDGFGIGQAFKAGFGTDGSVVSEERTTRALNCGSLNHEGMLKVLQFRHPAHSLAFGKHGAIHTTSAPVECVGKSPFNLIAARVLVLGGAKFFSVARVTTIGPIFLIQLRDLTPLYQSWGAAKATNSHTPVTR